MIDEVIDVNRPVYLVYSEYDLESHVGKMRQRHPNWSDRQCRCVLYWQGASKKLLKQEVKKAAFETKSIKIITKPEAMGVNVYATCRLSGLRLERIEGLKICRHVALIGQPRPY